MQKSRESFEMDPGVETMMTNLTEESISGLIYQIPGFKQIESSFKKHPTLREFYTQAVLTTKEIEKDFMTLEETLGSDVIKEFFRVENHTDLIEKLPISTVQRVINNTNLICKGLLQDILRDTYKRNIIDQFITVFLLIQLRKIKNPDSKLDITTYVNSILRPEWSFCVYAGFGKYFGSLNGNIKNNSSGQNHRLAAIVMYNHHREKPGLIEIFERIEYIRADKLIEFSTIMADGVAIDRYIEDHYFIKNEILDTQIQKLAKENKYKNHADEFKQYRNDFFQKIKQCSKNFTRNKETHIVINKQKLNELLSFSVEQVKRSVLESILGKNSKQLLLESLKIEFLKIIQENSFVFE